MGFSYLRRRWSFPTLFSFLLSFLVCGVLVHAQQTFFPASVPLAVRSPYFSAWVSTVNGSVYSQTWPTTALSPNGNLGWSGLVRIDGNTFKWLGDPLNVAEAQLIDMEVTPTRTVVLLQAGPMELRITFLSPIEPGDFARQSIPFTYVMFEAGSLDGNAHQVEVYSDISGEWVSGDRNAPIRWSTDPSSGIIYHSVTLSQEQPFVDVNGQAQWGTAYYAMQSDYSTTYKTGSDVDCRSQFNNTGTLDNGQDSDFRSLSTNFPVFAISRDLGLISSTNTPTVWTVGFVRDPVAQFTDISGVTHTRKHFFETFIANPKALISQVLTDFNGTFTRAVNLDTRLAQVATNAVPGTSYSDLVSLVARQVYGSTELTVGAREDGSTNSSDVWMLMRDNGASNTNRVQAVEIMFAAWPMLMYIDPSLGGPLLEPLLQAQDTPMYTLPYAAVDLGSTYPNITASNSPHTQGVEQCGNMIIMAYAHARYSGDGSTIIRHYRLLRQWAEYLVNNSISLPNQFSSDNFAVNNQTNLAIKGIIAIKAMAEISQTLGASTDANRYTAAARSLYNQWASLSLDTDDHMMVAYGQHSTWTLGYNLFVDTWLKTGVVDPEVLIAQANVIQGVLTNSSGITGFGVPLDSTSTDVVTSSWDMLAAAMLPNVSVRDAVIQRVHNRASFNISAGAFPLNYDSSKGSTILGIASPAQGAVFGAMALTLPVRTINVSGFSLTPRRKHTGAIVGGVFGAVAGVVVILGLALFLRRRRRRLDQMLAARPMVDEYNAPLQSGSWTTFRSQTSIVSNQSRGFNGQNMVAPPQPERMYGVSSIRMIEPSLRPGSQLYNDRTSTTSFSDSMSSEVTHYRDTYRPLPALPGAPDVPLPRQSMSKAALMVQTSSSSHRGMVPPLSIPTAQIGDSPISGGNTGSASQLVRGFSFTPGTMVSGSTVRSSVDMYAMQLREEVESLRREMQRLRSEQAPQEPPPSYS